jgi:hypothetical protein
MHDVFGGGAYWVQPWILSSNAQAVRPDGSCHWQPGMLILGPQPASCGRGAVHGSIVGFQSECRLDCMMQ